MTACIAPTPPVETRPPSLPDPAAAVVMIAEPGPLALRAAALLRAAGARLDWAPVEAPGSAPAALPDGLPDVLPDVLIVDGTGPAAAQLRFLRAAALARGPVRAMAARGRGQVIFLQEPEAGPSPFAEFAAHASALYAARGVGFARLCGGDLSRLSALVGAAR